MRTAEQVKKEIIRKYNKDPEEWKVWFSKDDKHNINWVFNHDRNLWVIKEYIVNPYKSIGVGGRTKEDSVSVSSQYLSFGLRPISESKALEILETTTPHLRLLKIAKIIIETPPQPIDTFQENYILHGPVFLCSRRLEDLSYKQKILQKKLDGELMRLKNKSLDYLCNMFI